MAPKNGGLKSQLSHKEIILNRETCLQWDSKASTAPRQSIKWYLLFYCNKNGGVMNIDREDVVEASAGLFFLFISSFIVASAFLLAYKLIF